MTLDKHIEVAFKATAPVTGQLAHALGSRRVTKRWLLKQVEQLKFATQQLEEAIALLPGKGQDGRSA